MGNLNMAFKRSDSHIFRKEYYSQDFVVKHTICPNVDDCPDLIISLSPGRSGSTGLLAEFMCNPYIGRGFYQPWKTLIRHGNIYGNFIIPTKTTGIEAIFTKDTLGPFSIEHEEFDPVELLIRSGYPLSKIKLILVIREPLSTFMSNLKFEGGIDPNVLISNIKYIVKLYDKYKNMIQTIPLAYDIIKNGVETVLPPLFDILGIEYHGSKFIEGHLLPTEKGGKLILGEARHPIIYSEIIAPTFSQAGFCYNSKENITVDSFSKNLYTYAKQIYDDTYDIYKKYYNTSKKELNLK